MAWSVRSRSGSSRAWMISPVRASRALSSQWRSREGWVLPVAVRMPARFWMSRMALGDFQLISSRGL